MFSDPAAVFATARPPILGLDTRDGNGLGTLRGLPYWNLDVAITKTIKLTERFSSEFQFNILNVLNHMQFADPSLNINNPKSFGVLNSQGNTPRQFEFGLRAKF